MRRKFTAVLVVLLTSLALALAPPAGAAIYSNAPNRSWAGYALDPATGANGGYEGAYQETVLPSTSTAGACTNDQVSVWVGLGGDAGSSNIGYTASAYPFVQNGWAYNGSGFYGAWYEYFDANDNGPSMVFLPQSTITAQAGDHVSMRVVFNHAHNDVWFVFNNLTTGTYAQVQKNGWGSYWNTNHVVTFMWEGANHPDFNSETFTDAHAEQVDGTQGLNSHGVPVDSGTNSESNSQTHYWTINNDGSKRVMSYLDNPDQQWHVTPITC
jgi:hypothetical protein